MKHESIKTFWAPFISVVFDDLSDFSHSNQIDILRSCNTHLKLKIQKMNIFRFGDFWPDISGFHFMHLLDKWYQYFNWLYPRLPHTHLNTHHSSPMLNKVGQAVSASVADFLAPHKKNSKAECALYVTFIFDLSERKFQLKGQVWYCKS